MTDLESREARPGDLGGPVSQYGLELRGGGTMVGEFKDLDEGKREVQVVFPHDTVDTYKTFFAPDCFRDKLQLAAASDRLAAPADRAHRTRQDGSGPPRPQRDRLCPGRPHRRSRAGQALAQIKSGTVRDHSFGFKDAVYQRAETVGKGVRRIARAFMAEVSPVSIG